MAIISLNVSDDELELFKSFAKHNNTSLFEIIRITMLEHIENEYDLKVLEEYEEEKSKGILKTRPINKIWEELGL